jgi:hypothetical protein
MNEKCVQIIFSLNAMTSAVFQNTDVYAMNVTGSDTSRNVKEASGTYI